MPKPHPLAFTAASLGFAVTAVAAGLLAHEAWMAYASPLPIAAPIYGGICLTGAALCFGLACIIVQLAFPPDRSG